jgi:hypothetical protein
LRWAICSCTPWSYKVVNSKDWVLGTDCELPIVETPRTVCKFSVVVLESLYTRFLSGPLDNPASNHKFRLKSGLVEGSSPYISFNRLLYVSWNKKWNHQIQENNNLRKKIVENQCTTKCWAQLLTNCCTFVLRSSLRTYVSIKSSIELDSCPRVVACKLKILLIKYIYE